MIEVADKFNMVDMGGIDIVESQGLAVDGLFTRLLNAIQNCRYQILYNWKFAKVEIAPSPVKLIFDGEKVSINDAVMVTKDDVVHIHSIEPEPVVPVIEPLTVSKNGIYEPAAGVDGYAPITVNVSGRSITQIMEQGQVSTTSAYATAYYGAGVDPTQYAVLKVDLWRDGIKIGTGFFFPVKSDQSIDGSDNRRYLFTTNETSIRCTQYSGEWADLYVDVYGISLSESQLSQLK